MSNKKEVSTNAVLHNKPKPCGRDAYHFIKLDNPDGDPIKCTFARPTRKILSTALRHMYQLPMDLISAGEEILLSCWVDGDEAIYTDDMLWLSACQATAKILEVREGELGNV